MESRQGASIIGNARESVTSIKRSVSSSYEVEVES